MRWMMRSLLSYLVLSVVPMSLWAQGAEIREVTGRLVFDRGSANCDLVPVELEIVEMQPIEVTYADSTCNFRFSKVSTGSYTIHVNIDGYEEVRSEVEVASHSGVMGMTLIQMISAPGRVARGFQLPTVLLHSRRC